jgi:transcriptional regulator with XRE-family HTH domain
MDHRRFIKTLYAVMGDESQKAFAKRLGISSATLSRIRSGLRRPGWRVIRALRREFPTITLAEWGLEDCLVSTEPVEKDRLHLADVE